MINSKIKKAACISVISFLSSACDADVSAQIAGVKWEKNEYKLLRFHNKEIQECRKSREKWLTKGSYEIDGNALMMKAGSRVTRGTIEVAGEGDKRVLILKNKDSEHHYKVDRSELCADINEEAVQDGTLPVKVEVSENLSIEIGGIKWERVAFSDQFVRFKNGIAEKCHAKEGTWKTLSPYKREGDSVSFSGGDKILLSITKGKGGQKTLSFDNNAAYQTTQSKACPMT